MSYNDTNMGFRPQSNFTPDGEKKPVIIQKLNVRPIARKTQDIDKWRRAIRAAESRSGRRTELYDLYADLMLDGHLGSVVEKRILAVTNSDWTFTDGKGDPVEAVTDWMDTPHFETLVKETVNAKMWGYSMIEFDFYRSGGPGTFLIPRKHMRPEQGAVSTDQSGYDLIDIRKGRYAKTVLEVGEDTDLGILMSVAQYAILKRGNFGDWAQFAEVFGMPLVDAVWDGYDEQQRMLLLEALNEMGSGGQIVRPAGTEINFQSGTGGGSSGNPTGELYAKLIETCNAEMSKRVLGQTETTESSASSGYAQAKQHGETEDDINKADRRYVRRILNGRVVGMLEDNGFHTQGGKFHIANEGEERLSKKDKISIDMQVRKSGTPISDDYFYDTYGIEKPDNYDEMVAEALEREAARAPDETSEKPREKTTGQKPKMRALAYRDKRTLISRLRDFFEAPAAGADKDARPLYDDACCDAPAIELAADRDIIEDIIYLVFTGQLKDKTVYGDFYFDLSEILKSAVLKGVGAEWNDAVNTLWSHLTHNLYAFSAAKSLTEVRQFTNALVDEAGEPVSYGRFRQKVIDLDEEFNDAYLRTEQRTAMRFAEMADKYLYLQKFDVWEYRTVRDDKVRESHRKLHGKKFRADDPVWDVIFPPNGWNCRCTVLPAHGKKPDAPNDLSELIASEAIPPYFRRNPGKDMQLFYDDHPYFVIAEKGGRRADDLRAADHYGMRPVARIYRATANLDIYVPAPDPQAAEAWFDAESEREITAVDGIRVLLGKAFRKATIDRKRIAGLTVRGNTSFAYAHLAPEVLTAPDEVWSRYVGGRLRTTYIKYYRDAPYLLTIADDGDGIVFRTFTKTTEAVAERARRGVLKHRS